jgi:hypothetical protein
MVPFGAPQRAPFAFVGSGAQAVARARAGSGTDAATVEVRRVEVERGQVLAVGVRDRSTDQHGAGRAALLSERVEVVTPGEREP